MMIRVLVAAVVLGLLAPAASAQTPSPNARVRLVYMVPADGIDRGLDTARIPDARDEIQHWLGGKVPRQLRVDDGVTFLRSTHSSADMAGASSSVAIQWIAGDLFASSLWSFSAHYGVYWDGTGPTCGSGGDAFGWHIGIVFLESCQADTRYPQAYSLTMLHELIHSMGGVVSPTARGLHVTDDPRDLMWPGIPSTNPALDSDRRDYVGHGDPARFDLLASSYFEPIPWCQSRDPFVALGRGTCCNGGWMPPGMACPRPASVVPAPPAPTPAPSASSCATSDPFVTLGGGICCNGGWIMQGMSCNASAPAPVVQAPTAPSTCTMPDPFTAIGGGKCVKGGWMPKGM